MADQVRSCHVLSGLVRFYMVLPGQVKSSGVKGLERMLMTEQRQGVQEKLCFFTIHCNPSLAYIDVRDLQSSRRNASVQSLLLAGISFYNQ